MVPHSVDDGIVFRLSRREDDESILALFEATFGRTLRPEWWRWFSYSCPTGLNRTYVAVDSATGRLAGSYSLLPYKVIYNGHLINASLCTNVNIHPDYQGRGIFVRIGHFALDGEQAYDCQLSLGVPNKNAYPGHIKVGWAELATLSFLAKFRFDRRNHLSQQVSRFGENCDQFLALMTSKFDFLVHKDHHFMNWRFVERPDVKYVIYTREERGTLLGYIVLKHYQERGGHYRKSHILDIHATSEAVIEDLLNAAESFASASDELNLWSVDMDPYRDIFLARGFEVKEDKNVLIGHTNHGALEPLHRGAWWFCLGDNDVY